MVGMELYLEHVVVAGTVLPEKRACFDGNIYDIQMLTTLLFYRLFARSMPLLCPRWLAYRRMTRKMRKEAINSPVIVEKSIFLSK